MRLDQDTLSPSAPERALILAHYERAAPFIAATFAGAPVVSVGYPNGLGTPGVYSASHPAPLPKSIGSVEVTTASGTRPYVAISENALLWLVHRYAVGFDSWTPSPKDPESVGFARLLLRQCGKATQEHLKFAMLAVRTVLVETGIESIAMFDGARGAALFVPFADLPTYESVRPWLHGVADKVVARNPALVTTQSAAHAGDRIEMEVSSNAVGRFSALPYSLAGTPELEMATPIDWTELGTIGNGTVTAATSGARLAKGDVFGVLAKRLAYQTFASAMR
jgi:DNA primase